MSGLETRTEYVYRAPGAFSRENDVRKYLQSIKDKQESYFKRKTEERTSYTSITTITREEFKKRRASFEGKIQKTENGEVKWEMQKKSATYESNRKLTKEEKEEDKSSKKRQESENRKSKEKIENQKPTSDNRESEKSAEKTTIGEKTYKDGEVCGKLWRRQEESHKNQGNEQTADLLKYRKTDREQKNIDKLTIDTRDLSVAEVRKSLKYKSCENLIGQKYIWHKDENKNFATASHEDFKNKENKMVKNLQDIHQIVKKMGELTERLEKHGVREKSRLRSRARSAESRKISSGNKSSTDSTPCSSPGPRYRMSSRSLTEEIDHPGSPKTQILDKFRPKTQKKFMSGCVIQRKTIPTRFSSTIIIKLGSTWRRFLEQVTLQNRLVPQRYSETISTPSGTPTKHYTSMLEIQCEGVTETTLEIPQPYIYHELMLSNDKRTPIFI